MAARGLCRTVALVVLAGWAGAAAGQVPPSAEDRAGYTGLFAAAARGDAARIKSLLAGGQKPDGRDAHGRTPLHVAAYGGHHEAMRALAAAGADPNALERDRYDTVTIAAVANDVPTLRVALALGASARNVTSRYDGTALIAAAHLGHAEVVRTLIRAGAPLDHVNNLGWTALIESIVLGDGGPRHTDTLAALLEAGANVNLSDRNGRTPLALAQARGYAAMVERLRRAGAVSGPALDRQPRRPGRAAGRPRLGHRRHASRGTAAPPGSAPPGRALWKASAATGTYPPPGGRLGWHPDCSPALAVRMLHA